MRNQFKPRRTECAARGIERDRHCHFRVINPVDGRSVSRVLSSQTELAVVPHRNEDFTHRGSFAIVINELFISVFASLMVTSATRAMGLLMNRRPAALSLRQLELRHAVIEARFAPQPAPTPTSLPRRGTDKHCPGTASPCAQPDVEFRRVCSAVCEPFSAWRGYFSAFR